MVTETAVISSLLNNEEYARSVLPFLDREYFTDLGQQVVFELIRRYFIKYNKIPSKDILQIELENKKLTENIYEKAISSLESITDTAFDIDWLIDNTEKWCQTQAFFNALMKSATIAENKDVTAYPEALELMQEAMSVAFDHSLGHDYLEDAEKRIESYRERKNRYACGLTMFDMTTDGGFVSPSLTVFIAPSGVGKSFMLCQLAASYMMAGLNVLYITLEMSDEETAKRIDSNLLDVAPDDLKDLEKITFMNKVKDLKAKTLGKLIIKEYPSQTAHAGHIRHLIRELKLKQKFEPQILIIDYLGIAASMQTQKGGMSLFEHGKYVSTEMRSLGQEFKIPVFTAAQVNREGTRDGDFEITDIAESWAIVANADYVYGMITNVELQDMNQMKIKRLKDRYKNYHTWYPQFHIGMDYTRMRFYNLNTYQAPDTNVVKKAAVQHEPQKIDKKEVDRRLAGILVDDE